MDRVSPSSHQFSGFSLELICFSSIGFSGSVFLDLLQREALGLHFRSRRTFPKEFAKMGGTSCLGFISTLKPVPGTCLCLEGRNLYVNYG